MMSWEGTNKIVILEAVVRRYSITQVFFKISQNSQENTGVGASFLIRLQTWGMHFY